MATVVGVFEEILLDKLVYFGCEVEKWLHKIATLHQLSPILFTFSQLHPMNIICAFHLLPILISKDTPNFSKRLKLNFGHAVIQCIDDHPLADEKVASNRH